MSVRSLASLKVSVERFRCGDERIPFNVFIVDAPVGNSVITVTSIDPDIDAQLVYSFINPVYAVDPQRTPVNINTYNYRVCILSFPWPVWRLIYTAGFALGFGLTGYIALCRSFHTEQSQIQIPILTAKNRNGIRIRVSPYPSPSPAM